MTRRRAATLHDPILSDFGPSVLADAATGEVRYAIPIVVEDVAVGTRGSIKRAKRADPLARVDNVTKGMRDAAERFRRAYEHVQAGIGMGPLDAGVDRVQEARQGDGLGVVLLSQERAYTASVWHTRGTQAIGLAAAGVVHWVVIDGRGVRAYEARVGWRNGGGSVVLVAALGRLARAYGYE